MRSEIFASYSCEAADTGKDSGRDGYVAFAGFWEQDFEDWDHVGSDETLDFGDDEVEEEGGFFA